MDYSLLLIIEKRKPDSTIDSSGHQFLGETHIYHIAIIDYLQEWNALKKSERFLKTKIKMLDGDTLSTIHPKEYGDRFASFMGNYVIWSQ